MRPEHPHTQLTDFCMQVREHLTCLSQIINLMGRIIRVGILLAIFFLWYLLFSPIEDFEPEFQPEARNPVPSSTVDHDFMNHLKVTRYDGLDGPEDLDVDEEAGIIYTGLGNGRVAAVSPAAFQVITNGLGTIAGIKLSTDKQHLYYADMKKSICRLNLKTRQVELLTSGYQGVPFKFLNGLDVDAEGCIFVTDSSTKYGPDQVFVQVMETKPHGRVYRYDPNTQATEIVLDNLYYPNGIQVSPDGSALYVSEMTANRVIRYHLQGSKAGERETVVEGLPGGPDNLKFNQHGELWIAIPLFRDSMTQWLMSYVWTRRFVARLPAWVLENGLSVKEVGGMKIDVNSKKPLATLRSSDTSKMKFFTTILQKNGKIYTCSLQQNAIGVMESNKIRHHQPTEEPSEL